MDKKVTDGHSDHTLYFDFDMINSKYSGILAEVLRTYENRGGFKGAELLCTAKQYTDMEDYDALICLIMNEFHLGKYLIEERALNSRDLFYQLLEQGISDVPKLGKGAVAIRIPKALPPNKRAFLYSLSELEIKRRSERARDILLSYLQLTGESTYVRLNAEAFLYDSSVEYAEKGMTHHIDEAIDALLHAGKLTAAGYSSEAILNQLQKASFPEADILS